MTAAQRRTILLGLLAALSYYALLSLVAPALPYVPIPAWWRDVWLSPGAAALTWFGLMDAAAAFFAAVPVAVLLIWRIREGASAVGLATGVLVAAYVLCSAVVEYGTGSKILFAAANQFIWVSLALPVVALILGRGKNIRD